MSGRPIAVVGPSGAGKDTLIAALRAARPDIAWARRVITRDADVNDEEADCVTEAEFEARRAAGEFALQWSAHGLHYGIPRDRLAPLAEGRDLILSLSRAVLGDLAALPGARVLWVTARPEVLAERLAARGREDAAGIAARLRRDAASVPDGLVVHEIDNSGTIAAALAQALAALYPGSAPDSATVSRA